jgi:hypothetical protein
MRGCAEGAGGNDLDLASTDGAIVTVQLRFRAVNVTVQHEAETMHRELLQERCITDARVLATVNRVMERCDPELVRGRWAELEQRSGERLRIDTRAITEVMIDFPTPS